MNALEYHLCEFIDRFCEFQTVFTEQCAKFSTCAPCLKDK